MDTYTTSEAAKIIGMHPNTVRLYEKWGLIPEAIRKPNGYRVFTDFHIEQLRFARLALQIEVLHNGLRKKVIDTIKISAKRDFDNALSCAEEYRRQIQKEQQNAKEAILIVKQILAGKPAKQSLCLRRKEVSEHLGVSMDTLRNWELNGLFRIKRKQNGYRVYTSDDIEQLKIIRSLRCANYSLEAIMRMLQALSDNPQADIEQALNTPKDGTDIISACDRLIVSLQTAEKNAGTMIDFLTYMKTNFS